LNHAGKSSQSRSQPIGKYGFPRRARFVASRPIFVRAGGIGVDADGADGPFFDLGGNLIGVANDANFGFNAGTTQVGSLAHPLDPLLGPLGNNGGPVIGAPGTSLVLQTEALKAGSKALGKGIKAGAPLTDERGVKNGAIITIGAVNV
jgi:hypothetical protein